MTAARAPDRFLFAFAVGCSAFLVFLVQPLVGKRLLPWFGGAPAVWTLCLAFYQTTLFAGYAYAHGLRRLRRPGLELAVHGALFVAAWFALPVLPSDAWRPGPSSSATAVILLALLANVALPFVFLCATGPLVQAWFARAHPSRAPYFLYALSNLGSLAALLAYPSLIEPQFGLAETGERWSLGFAVVGVAVLGCGGLAVWRGRGCDRFPMERIAGDESAVGVTDIALWIALSGVAVVLLMGITNQLCLDVASVPFLWVLPLAIYLLTFILCFASERVYRRLPFVLLAAVAALLLPFSDYSSDELGAGSVLRQLPVVIGMHALLLFATCMVLHGELYRRRPPASELTAYYLYVSAGGALGGLFVGIGAERWFADYYEVPIALGAWCGLVLLLAMRDPKGLLRGGTPGWRKAIACLLGVALLLHMLASSRYRVPEVIHQERGFFGVLRVREISDGDSSRRILRHGTTLHGVQLMNRMLRGRPTSYYGLATGIGFVLRERAQGPPLRVGLVGLGIGTLAAYGRPGDLYRFYEIDPAVIRIARDSGFFTFLEDSAAEIEIIEGDGRLALEAEQLRGEAGMDLLVLDAFSSDSVPVHLLTREAFALYMERLVDGGLLAVHVSNRHLDLGRVSLRLAEEAGHSAILFGTGRTPRFNGSPAIWVFVSRDSEVPERLRDFVETQRRRIGLPERAIQLSLPEAGELRDTPLWTDDYSDLLGILRAAPRSSGP